MTLPGNTLLDDSSTEISIDQALSGAPNRVAQGRIIHPLTVSEAGEHLGLEGTQSGPRHHFSSSLIYSTKCDVYQSIHVAVLKQHCLPWKS